MQILKKLANLKFLKLLPYFLFVPICNLLYKIIFWFPDYLRECVFYLRVPIISAILIFLLFPIIILNSLLRNVLIMTKWEQVSLGIISILLTGRSIVVVANAILENAPTRFGIAVPPTFIFPWDYGCPIILGLPLILGIIWQTYHENKFEKWAEIDSKIKSRYEQQLVKRDDLLLGCLVGFFGDGVIFVIDKLLLLVLEYFKSPISALFLTLWKAFEIVISALFSTLLPWIKLEPSDLSSSGYFYPQEDKWLLASGHLAGLSFFLISLILFFVIGYFFRPNYKSDSAKGEAPVIIYMMAFLAIVVPLLATMTFALDLSGFPVVVTAICFVAVSYWLWDVDYYFGLKPSPDKDQTNLGNFETAVERRLKLQGDFETAVGNRLKLQGSKERDRTLVVVTASGGGIHAAGWTAQVLTGLQDWLGADFTKSIGLISSVSGGSVGSLFFVDYC